MPNEINCATVQKETNYYLSADDRSKIDLWLAKATLSENSSLKSTWLDYFKSCFGIPTHDRCQNLNEFFLTNQTQNNYTSGEFYDNNSIISPPPSTSSKEFHYPTNLPSDERVYDFEDDNMTFPDQTSNLDDLFKLKEKTFNCGKPAPPLAPIHVHAYQASNGLDKNVKETSKN